VTLRCRWAADDLRRCAPSIFAEHARPGVSARYTFVSTQQVVALIGAEGWEPVKEAVKRRHSLTFDK